MSFVVSLALLISLGNMAHVPNDSCPSAQDEDQGEECGSPLMVDAGCTSCIHFKADVLRQYHGGVCHEDEPQEYRTFDGTCNHVYNLGSANTPFKRLIPPAYADTMNSPRSRGVDGYPLPIPTDVSGRIHTQHNCPMPRTAMFVQWGQFIDHDLTLAPVPMKDGRVIFCCERDKTFPDHLKHPSCLPIKLGHGDTNIRFLGNCMEFVRSLPARTPYGRILMPREQVNQLTAFIDGSAIYGSSDKVQKELRETNEHGKPGAKMKTSKKNLLPAATEPDCIHRVHDYCYRAGDDRVNVQPGLMAIHIIWVRMHNIIVDGLRPQRPHDTDEQLFQEARKIVVAILQMIHYKEWLPFVIGVNAHGRFKLWPEKWFGRRSAYSHCVDPRITNAFATAAFRFGHSLLPEHLVVSGTHYKFRHIFFRPDLIFDDYDSVVRALLDTTRECRAQKCDRFIVKELTDHLFTPLPNITRGPSHGLDLVALNIQRGRDHGLPPYNKFRKHCGLPPVTNFTEFGSIGVVLRQLYRSVEDIDLFVGGLLERPERWGAVGPTFACIQAQQFHALKFGDRFYFETDHMPEGFSDDRLQAIRNVTFAHVCCLTANITSLQQNVFLTWGETVACDSLRKNFLDFTLWKRH